MRLQYWLQFLTEGIWRITEDEVTPVRKRLYSCLKVIYLSVDQFLNDRISVRASALTYSTLLSIIPILALLFAIARGFGFNELMEQQLKTGIANKQSELILSWVNSYLEHAQSGVFIGVGLIMLLWTVLMLTDNIERSFNAIWQVKHPRTVFRKITDYFSMMLLLPLLIVISSGLTIFMTTYVKDLETFMLLGPVVKFLVRLIPYALIWGMLGGLYVFMPNTKVKIRNAWFPAILAGSAFQAFQYFYVNSQIWISNYNAIYGSFAAIPMFLLWTQISWTIVLFGAEMSYISQNLPSFSFGKETAHISRRYHIRLTKNILYELTDIHLIYETFGEDRDANVRYLPGMDINQLTVGALMERLDSAGAENFKIDKDDYSASWQALIDAKKEYIYQNGRILLKDL